MIIPKRNKVLKEISIFTKVRPLARPRENYRQPKENQKKLLRELYNYKNGNIINEPIIIDINFYFKSNNYLIYPTGQHIGDIDNLIKAVYDALVSCEIIHDDKIVVGGSNYKMCDSEDYANIFIYSVKGVENESCI